MKVRAQWTWLWIIWISCLVGACRGGQSGANARGPDVQRTSELRSSARDLFAFSARDLEGHEQPLARYRGQVALVVNTASECGFTPQYAGLESLYRRYRDRGFVVLGFPSDDFGGQEPGTEAEIAAFTRTQFGVTFPLFSKVHADEENASGVFAMLGHALGFPKWNFHKYLVDRQGRPIAAFSSWTEPESRELRAAVEEALGAKP